MIDDTTIKTEATKLREELKRGRQQRNIDSGTTESNVGDLPGEPGATRPGIQVFHGTGATDGSRKGAIRRDGRSTVRGNGRFQGQPEQPGSEYRRPDKQHAGIITSGIGVATERARRSLAVSPKQVGNFERIDDVPRRTITDETKPEPTYTPREKRSPGRPKKVTLEPTEKVIEPKISLPSTEPITRLKNFIPTGRFKTALTDQEVKQFGPILKSALKDYGRYADQYLNYRLATAGTIWGNLDSDELESLVGALLSIGKRNGSVAEGVRLVANSNDYLTTVMILVPRLMQTTQVLQQAPKRTRPNPLERTQALRGRFRSRFGEKI